MVTTLKKQDPPKPPVDKTVGTNAGNTANINSWNSAKTDLGDYSGFALGATANKLADGTVTHLNMLTGEQALVLFERMAYHNPAQFGQVRNLLVAAHAYSGTKTPSFKAPWTSADEAALKRMIINYHVNTIDLNTGSTTFEKDKPKPFSFYNFLYNAKSSVKDSGYTPDQTKKAAVIPLPATEDLQKTAQDAFAKVLGHSATPADQAEFAKMFQDTVYKYYQDKNSSNPNFQPLPQGTGMMGAKQPNVPVATPPGAVIQPPDPTVAAANFAAHKNPVNAVAQQAVDALGDFTSMLKG